MSHYSVSSTNEEDIVPAFNKLNICINIYINMYINIYNVQGPAEVTPLSVVGRVHEYLI